MAKTNLIDEGEFGKTKVYRRKGKDYHRKLKAQAEGLKEKPTHPPYHRDNRGNLRNSLMVDGLGEESN